MRKASLGAYFRAGPPPYAGSTGLASSPPALHPPATQTHSLYLCLIQPCEEVCSDQALLLSLLASILIFRVTLAGSTPPPNSSFPSMDPNNPQVAWLPRAYECSRCIFYMYLGSKCQAGESMLTRRLPETTAILHHVHRPWRSSTYPPTGIS